MNKNEIMDPDKSFSEVVKKTFLTPQKRKRSPSPPPSKKPKKRKLEEMFELQTKIVTLQSSIDRKDQEILSLSISRNNRRPVNPSPVQYGNFRREIQERENNNKRINFDFGTDEAKQRNKYEEIITNLANENQKSSEKISELYDIIKKMKKQNLQLQLVNRKDKIRRLSEEKNHLSDINKESEKGAKKSDSNRFKRIDPEKEEYIRLYEKYKSRTEILERELGRFKSPISMKKFVNDYPPTSTYKERRRRSILNSSNKKRSRLSTSSQRLGAGKELTLETPSRSLPFNRRETQSSLVGKDEFTGRPGSTIRRNTLPFLEEDFDLDVVEIPGIKDTISESGSDNQDIPELPNSTEQEKNQLRIDLNKVRRILSKRTPSPILPPPPLPFDDNNQEPLNITLDEEEEEEENEGEDEDPSVLQTPFLSKEKSPLGHLSDRNIEESSDYSILLREVNTTMKTKISDLENENKELKEKIGRNNFVTTDDRNYLITLKEENVNQFNMIEKLKKKVESLTKNNINQNFSIIEELNLWRETFSNICKTKRESDRKSDVFKVSSYISNLQKKNREFELESVTNSSKLESLLEKQKVLEANLNKKESEASELQKKYNDLLDKEIPALERKMVSSDLKSQGSLEIKRIAERELQKQTKEHEITKNKLKALKEVSMKLKNTSSTFQKRVNDQNLEIQNLRKSLDEKSRVVKFSETPPVSKPEQIEEKSEEIMKNLEKKEGGKVTQKPSPGPKGGGKDNGLLIIKLNRQKAAIGNLEKKFKEVKSHYEKTIDRRGKVFRKRVDTFQRAVYLMTGFSVSVMNQGNNYTVFELRSMFNLGINDKILVKFENETNKVAIVKNKFTTELKSKKEFEECFKFLSLTGNSSSIDVVSFLTSLQIKLLKQSNQYFRIINNKNLVQQKK